MSQPEIPSFLASVNKRFQTALITRLETETGLSKEPGESLTKFNQRTQQALGWSRFKELAEEAANSAITFKLP